MTSALYRNESLMHCFELMEEKEKLFGKSKKKIFMIGIFLPSHVYFGGILVLKKKI